MSDWIDKYLYDYQEQAQQQENRRQALYALGQRYWESLGAVIRRDATKLNAKAMSLLKSEIEINKRSLVPTSDELNVDRLAFPAIRLTIRLDLHAESIKITQSRKETPESDYDESTERLQLDVSREGQLVIKDANGKRLTIEEVSQYILGRFLKE
ncbi:MAG: hypothetical protein AB1631_21855 [Acidobacteriota bacterium]